MHLTRRLPLVGAIVGTLTLAGRAVSPSCADVPLSVVPESVQPGKSTISLRVTNTGTLPITAYALEVTVRLPDGKSMTYQTDADSYLIADQRHLLEPGESRVTAEWLPAGVTLSDVSTTVTAAVFDDTTTTGRPAVAKTILERRATERDEMRRWLTTLKELLVRHADRPARDRSVTDSQRVTTSGVMSEVSLDAKTKAFADLDSLLSRQTGPSRVVGSLRNHIREANRYELAQREAKLQMLVNTLEIQYANAVKHSPRAN
jgi:hypothetical protein